MTHWQHPSFHAYFPANSSPPSILAEMLTATMGAQCMMWQTSPAAAEMEERMMQWLAQMIGLPESFVGVIQDTASTATLCSLLTARERATGYEINRFGFKGSRQFAVYCSTETHSSIEKDVKIAGLGSESLRKIKVDYKYALDPAALEAAIEADIYAGVTPLCVVATLGTTGSTAIDPLKSIARICTRHKVWLHVDAAFLGNALMLDENRGMIEGIQSADTFVFNPHKWMFTNFDCSAYFVQDKEALIRTFEIMPEYLRTSEAKPVNNYRDWGIPLGRRFRALKLWFVIRSYGVDGLKERLRDHIRMAQEMSQQIEASRDFQLMAPVPLSLVCFRYHPQGVESEKKLEHLNKALEETLNHSGDIFLTHARLRDRFVLRFCVGQTQVQQRDVDRAWGLIQETARALTVD
jgi:aromatic-L-amino-acid decarboxylase